MSDRFLEAKRRLDQLNAEDPNHTDGRPRELVQADWLSDWIEKLRPDASEALRLAARAQHLMRWKVRRSDYEAGRTGYRLWRRAAMDFHAAETRRVLESVGYDAETIDQVARIVQKHGLRKNDEVQTMEDALCLSFLQHDLAAFAEKHDDAKLVHILKETWNKMSELGRKEALALVPALSPRLQQLIARATTD
jgi:hypothetical protein